MNFESIASDKWQQALNICDVNLGEGKQQGNEIVFKNIFTNGQSYNSLRYLPHKEIFMNHCAIGSEMHLNPVKFISKYKNISQIEAYILLKKSLGEWKESFLPFGENNNKLIYSPIKKEINSEVVLGKFSSQFRTLQECWQNETYRKRCKLLTLISEKLENTKNLNASKKAKEWWESRSFDPKYITEGKKSFVLLESTEQLENLSCVKQMTLEEKYLTGIWTPHTKTGKPVLQWISKDYLVLFFCWNYIQDHLGKSELIVTGVRARYTSKQPTSNPKEVTLGIKHIKELEGFPASLGYYGLLISKYKKYTGSTWSQLNGCKDFTVILTEGCTDMLAGRHLIRDQNVIFATSGQIQSAMWNDHLRQIKDCKHLVIAFNNDTHSNKNTGQEIAQKTKEEALKYGIKNVDILPTELLNNCNDLNELLKKKKASGCPLEALINFCKG